MMLQVSLGRTPAGSAVPSAVNDEMSSQVGTSALLLITVVYVDGTLRQHSGTLFIFQRQRW